MIAVFGLFVLIGTTAGLVFNTVTIALPKVIDERITGISLVAVGSIATGVFSAARSRNSPSGACWRNIRRISCSHSPG